MKNSTKLWLVIALLASFSARADIVVADDQIVTSTSDGTAPAYDCSVPTLAFFPGPPSSGFVPAGEPVISPPAPDIESCSGFPLMCEFTCGEPVNVSLCVGLDCVNGESFGDAELKVKENNLRIRYVDTSVGEVFGQSWNVEANSSANGGLHYLAFQVKSLGGDELLFSDGTAPAYNCAEPTLPFLFGSDIDPTASIGIIPVGDPILEPVPSDLSACQTDYWANTSPSPALCAFTCPHKKGFTEQNVLLLGTGDPSPPDAGPSFNNGVAIGANSVPENGKVTVGQAGLLRALKHLAIGLTNTDVLNYGNMRLQLAAVNSQLDVIEARIAALEGSPIAANPYDVNGDGTVNFADVMAIMPCYGRAVASNPQCVSSDVNLDGIVNILDISQVRGNINL